MRVTEIAFLKIVLLVLATSSLTACITEHVDIVNEVSDKPDRLYSTKQAISDAEQAVREQQFALLAFTNKVITFPGIDISQYPLEVIEQQCGVKYLSGTGDTLRIGESTDRRKALKKYASSYNLIVFQGCQSFHKNN